MGFLAREIKIGDVKMKGNLIVKIGTLVLILAMLVYAQQPVTVANSPSVTITSGTVTANLGTTAGGAGQLALDATLTGGTLKAEMYDGSNVLGTTAHPVIEEIYDGTNIIGSATHPIQVSLANTASNATAVSVSFAAGNTISLVPVTSGGLTMKHFVAAATDNTAFAKASGGQLYDVDIFNNAGYPVYFKLYNKATAPTCGSDTVVKVVGVQAGTGRTFLSDTGLAFSTGIAYCLVKGIADNDDTSTALSDATVDMSYK
jgi:hypothetical protein